MISAVLDLSFTATDGFSPCMRICRISKVPESRLGSAILRSVQASLSARTVMGAHKYLGSSRCRYRIAPATTEQPHWPAELKLNRIRSSATADINHPSD